MTTTEMPAVEVTAATPTPYAYGLFSVAPAATPPADRWTAGVWWQSVGCNRVGVTYMPCNVEDELPEKVANVSCIVNTAPSFTVYSRSDESVGGSPLADKFQRARDVLLAGEQFGAERALWGLLLDATAAPDDTPTTIAEGLALVEQRLAMAYGGTGVIHVSRYTATYLAAMSMIETGGARLRTKLGTPVVAGGGYSDEDLTDPVSIIGTGALVVIRGEVFNLGEVVDRFTNSIEAVVERSYVAGWDCTAIRAEVTPA